jgi:hypothetical protein
MRTTHQNIQKPATRSYPPNTTPQTTVYAVSRYHPTTYRNGRPPIFVDPQEMQTAVDAYFDSCYQDKLVTTITPDGHTTIESVRYQFKSFTMAGLAMYLGMTTTTLREYAKKDDDRLSAIVISGRQRIEEFCEQQLHEGKNAGTIFNLMQCNFGYRMPKTEITQELTGKDGTPLNPATNDERARATREAMLAELNGIPLQIHGREE